MVEHRHGRRRHAHDGHQDVPSGGQRCRVLHGRSSECRALGRLLDATRTGDGRVLVLRGAQGVGKTALLEHVVERASGCRVARTAGVRSETDLDFAGLHQLCGPMVDRIDALPGPQRESLHAAFGQRDGSAPGHFLVGMAVLGLVTEIARERPLVCLVDDAQWLDRASAQVLAFVARRVGDESVGMVFATRTPDDAAVLAGLPELAVDGLPDDDARAFLASELPGPVDERVLDRIVAETRGNPMALRDLARGSTPAELAGGFGLPGAAALPPQLEDSIRRQLAPLRDDTRQLLLIAAAEPAGDPVLVWRAAQRSGIGADAGAAAAETDLLEIDAQVRFRHPLVRSAVYLVASAGERRSAHRALADATDPEVEPDRRAWHAAHAVHGSDDDAAADLDRSAGRAQVHGGLAAVAAFLERAVELTREPECRTERALAAAEAAYQAGPPDAALKLLCLAEAGPLTKLQRAQADLLRARVAFATRRGDDASSLLLAAAEQLEPLDVRLARDTYLDALAAAVSIDGPAVDTTVREVAGVARVVAPAPHPPRPADLLLDGLAVRFTDGYAAGMPMLEQAVEAFRNPDLGEREGLRWLWLASETAAHVWDDESWHALTGRHVQLARDAGALTALPRALDSCITERVLVGELEEAAALREELTTAGNAVVPPGALLLAGWRGRETAGLELLDGTTMECWPRDPGPGPVVAGWASAVHFNSLGRYDDALAAIEQTGEHTPAMGLSTCGLLVELVEAAVRAGTPGCAADALDRLAATTGESGTDWALGVEARCRALLTGGPAAEPLYREAIDRLGRTRIRGELARAHLLHGEWLRRGRRRLEAREQLRTAHTIFTEIGAEGFARRARRELAATGETARKRTVETTNELTAHEAEIARLVRQGLTNPEISGRLYISPRTVEWHLSRIYGKLDINSRKELRGRGPRTNPTAGDA